MPNHSGNRCLTAWPFLSASMTGQNIMLQALTKLKMPSDTGCTCVNTQIVTSEAHGLPSRASVLFLCPCDLHSQGSGVLDLLAMSLTQQPSSTFA